MPRKKQSTTEKNATKVRKAADWGGYLQLNLTADEKASARAWIEAGLEDGTVLRCIENLIADDFKLSAVRDSESDAVISSLLYTDLEARKNYVITAHGSHFLESVALLCWKHFVLLEADWSTIDARIEQMNFFG